jgi:hypothetical protein
MDLRVGREMVRYVGVTADDSSTRRVVVLLVDRQYSDVCGGMGIRKGGVCRPIVW